MRPLFLALPGNEDAAMGLAAAAGGSLCACEFRTFPDGESYLRVEDDPCGRTVVLVCSLVHPNEKILPLIFAADTLRELGVDRLGLVAPYLAYMRQDCRFHAGEAVTSRSFAGLICRSFDWLVTVDPHLHRYNSLEEIYSIPCRALHAGPLLADWIERNVDRPFLIGPDNESRQWVAAVAFDCGAGSGVFQKSRLSDRSVSIAAGHLRIPPNATPVLVDDIVSSGATMLKALEAVREQTPAPAIAMAIHGVGGDEMAAAFGKINARLVTTNSNSNPKAEIDILGLLASGLKGLID